LVPCRADAALPDVWLADAWLAGGGVLEETGVDVSRCGFGGLVAGAAAALMLPKITVSARVTSSHVLHLKTRVDTLWC
jgi:hypothetical protein